MSVITIAWSEQLLLFLALASIYQMLTTQNTQPDITSVLDWCTNVLFQTGFSSQYQIQQRKVKGQVLITQQKVLLLKIIFFTMKQVNRILLKADVEKFISQTKG